MRPSAQKWNVGPERRKERATFCGRFGKRTPFLRGRVQLQGCEQKRSETMTVRVFAASGLKDRADKTRKA